MEPSDAYVSQSWIVGGSRDGFVSLLKRMLLHCQFDPRNIIQYNVNPNIMHLVAQ